MSVLAVIPARGGSKGVPRKNLSKIAGKPLVAWTIEAALSSTVIDRVIVSTDDREIAETACNFGAEAPWLRPDELAGDDAPALGVARHALEACATEGFEPEWLFLLQPTSPLRISDDIIGALDLVKKAGGDSVVSVTETHIHPAWMFHLNAGQGLSPWQEGSAATNRQDRETLYVPNGAIYLARSSLLRGGGSWYNPQTLGWIMPHDRSLDIDSQFDVEIANILLEKRFNGTEQ